MSDAMGWTGMTPQELAARIKAHPFADVREPLMQKITLAALARALPLTPVRTGALRRSETNRVETGGLKGWIGSNVNYAPFVHANVPFLKKGIDNSAPERDRLLQDAGDEYLKGLT